MERKEYRLMCKEAIEKKRNIQRYIFTRLKVFDRIGNPSSVEECVSMVLNRKPKVKRKEYEY